MSSFLYLNENLNNLAGNTFWVFITNFDDGFFLFPLAMLLAWKRPDRQLDILIANALAGIALCVVVCEIVAIDDQCHSAEERYAG